MNRILRTLRRLGPAVALVTTLLVVALPWVAGVHHHEGAGSHSCATCVNSHAPAAPALATVHVSAPQAIRIGVAERTEPGFRDALLGVAPGRAPPVA